MRRMTLTSISGRVEYSEACGVTGLFDCLFQIFLVELAVFEKDGPNTTLALSSTGKVDWITNIKHWKSK
jgi:hypothetical protein